MDMKTSFRGRSGKAWSFTKIDKDISWAQSAGVAIFAAPDSYGWRLIRVVELSGRPHDTRAIWALADAERYGATAVFLAPEIDKEARRNAIADIEAGLSPVCPSNVMSEAA